ncbi:50S ribosomal protein L11 [bacterium 3DAC]|jgi:large subunit ribosomal protein L11|nr:50S ribosomal protein L11 [Dictyoglomota bacterium]UZN23403.1 50S ribosomal protein L11 [bacterium 3DAC]
MAPKKKSKKKIVDQFRMVLPAGKASPAPPVGPILGQRGINIMAFCKAFNAKTAQMGDVIVPVDVTVYADKSFSFEIKTPPASFLLKRAAGVAKGSSEPNKVKVGKVTRKQVKEIAESKMKDLNTDDIEAAMRMIEGTARSMGIEVVD